MWLALHYTTCSRACRPALRSGCRHQRFKDALATDIWVSYTFGNQHYHTVPSCIFLHNWHGNSSTSDIDRGSVHSPGKHGACTQGHCFHDTDLKSDGLHHGNRKLLLCTNDTWFLYHFNPRILQQRLYHALQQHHCMDTSLQRLGMDTLGTSVHLHYESSVEGLCERGSLGEAVHSLLQLNAAVSTKAYLCLLQACNRNKKDLSYASRIYAHMVQHNAPKTTFLGDYLAMTLANCGAVDDACQVAFSLPRRSVLAWTSIISAYTECGNCQAAIRLHQHMLQDGIEPNSYTYVSLFKACSKILDLDSGKKLHAEARIRGLAGHIFVGSTLVSMYGKCGAVAEAEDVFVALPCRDPVSWNAMLTAYIEQKKGEQALRLFRQMQEEKVTIDKCTLLLALQALADMNDTLVVSEYPNITLLKRVGLALHAEALRKGLVSDIMVGSALLSMYGKYGSIQDADNVFTLLVRRDTISWNAMIAAYIELGNEEIALQFFIQMQKDGLSPDETTFMMVFRACGNIAEKGSQVVKGLSNKVTTFELGQALHGDAHDFGCAADTQVANTLVCMYGKCGAIAEAEDVFNGLSCRGVVSWTVLLTAYAEQGHAEKALEFYKKMELEHVTKDDIALVSALQACGVTGVVETCRQLHFEIISAGFDNDFAIITALIISYRSCASMAEAHSCFDELSQPTSVLWNACMAGHAGEGSHIACLALFENMKATGVQPNELTFISALSACRHTGLVRSSLEYFESLSRDYDINPSAKHYGVVLDLLGRVGCLIRVRNVIERMPVEADAAVWFSVLGACGTHVDTELAKWAFRYALELKHQHPGSYVLLLNLCRDPGLQELAAKMDYYIQLQGAVDMEKLWFLLTK
ncbi:hypothetical protein L7F22_067431 [Adiantum nelumboides]|nr:hypothetical protein [Adiantum nelumboides]